MKIYISPEVTKDFGETWPGSFTAHNHVDAEFEDNGDLTHLDIYGADGDVDFTDMQAGELNALIEFAIKRIIK
jgi:hypothetical protein